VMLQTGAQIGARRRTTHPRDRTTGNVHSGTFDNQFWINGTTGGPYAGLRLRVRDHWHALNSIKSKNVHVPFDASHLITSTGSTSWVVNNTKGDECSPLTEFYNGTTDRMFFGVGNTTDGFIESSTITATASAPNCTAPPTSSCVTAPSRLGGTSGIVIDNQVSSGGTNIYFSTLVPGSVNGQNCHVTGGLANPLLRREADPVGAAVISCEGASAPFAPEARLQASPARLSFPANRRIFKY
jgi:hypothetical protein